MSLVFWCFTFLQFLMQDNHTYVSKLYQDMKTPIVIIIGCNLPDVVCAL